MFSATARRAGPGSSRGGLAGAEGLEEVEEGGPLRGRDGEVSAEVEQGELAEGGAGAFGADEAEGGVRIGGGSGRGG